MKLTVFSDSHGNMENVLRIFDDSPADRYLFCGDGLTDAEDAAHLRDVPLTAVAGNCDYGSTARTEWLLELEGVRILLTHGHGYAVKQGTGALLRRARELEAQVVLFGHTHQRLLEEAGFRETGFAASGGEARRMLLSGSWDALVINGPLSDEFGHQLAMDAAEEGTGVLLAVKNELWEEVNERVAPLGVLTLGRPFSRGMFAQAMGLLLASQAKVERCRAENERLRQKLEELRIVSRAKCLLVEYLHLTEEEAHKYLERIAMEERKTRRSVAEEILREYE